MKAKVTPKTVKPAGKSASGELEQYHAFAEKAAEIATYYGYSRLTGPRPEDKQELPKPTLSKKPATPRPLDNLDGASNIMQSYIDQNMMNLPQPIKLFVSGTLKEEDDPKPAPKCANDEFSLEVLGSQRSIADAMTIFVAMVALKETGFQNLFVEINTIGDAESRKEYQKQLVAYYRKVATHICPDCKQHLKTDPLAVLECKKPMCQPHKEKAPQTIAHLSPESKQHFKEVLEFLDALDIVYRINTNLVRGFDFYTHTVFEISETPEDDAEPVVFVSGGRYEAIGKKLGIKKDISATSCTMDLATIVNHPHYKPSIARAQKKAKIYFIQIGFEAKLKSMEVLEILRTARIPVMHALAKDSLMQQLATAEKSGVQHAIIFGQKEAIDRTVILRNLETRSQEIVKIKDLADHIKREL